MGKKHSKGKRKAKDIQARPSKHLHVGQAENKPPEDDEEDEQTSNKTNQSGGDSLLQEQLQAFDKRISELEQDNERTNEKVMQLEQEKGLMNEKVMQLEQEKGLMNEKVMQLEQEKGLMNEKVMQLEQEKERMKQENERTKEGSEENFMAPIKAMYHTPIRDPDPLIIGICLDPLTSLELGSLKKNFIVNFKGPKFNLQEAEVNIEGESNSFAHKVAYTLPLLGHDDFDKIVNQVLALPPIRSYSATTESQPATTESQPATTESQPATTESQPATTESHSATTESPSAARLPKGSHSKSSRKFFRSVNPVFSSIRDEEIYTRFNLLQSILKDSINENTSSNNSESIRKFLDFEFASQPFSGESDIGTAMSYLLDCCLRMLSVTGLIMKRNQQVSLKNPKTRKRDLIVDIMVRYEDVPLLLVETRRTGLHMFVDEETGELKSNTENFRSILKQCCMYMYATGLHHIFISDFTTTILVMVNMTGDQADQPKGRTFNGCFDFRVIRASDPSISLHAVINSILLLEFAAEASRRNDYDKFPPALKAWSDSEFVEPHIKKFNDMKTIAKKCLKNIVLPEEEIVKDADTTMKAGSALLQSEVVDNDSVDFERFKDLSVVYWKQGDQLERIQFEPDTLSDVFGFTFDDNWIFKDPSNVPPRGTKLILKVYDPLNSKFEDPPVLSYFLNEITALTKIHRYNSQSDETIGVPDVYDYGGVRFHLEDELFFYGFYILMSYVEDEEESMDEQEVKSANEKIDRDLSVLERIGIDHGDVARRNKRINRVHPMLIDYSHARIRSKKE